MERGRRCGSGPEAYWSQFAEDVDDTVPLPEKSKVVPEGRAREVLAGRVPVSLQSESPTDQEGKVEDAAVPTLLDVGLSQMDIVGRDDHMTIYGAAVPAIRRLQPNLHWNATVHLQVAMRYIVLLVTVATAWAGLPSKRANTEVTGTGFTSFQNQFRAALALKVSVEFNLTQPLLAALETDMNDCARRINDTRDSCQFCAQSKCQGAAGDILSVGINSVGSDFDKLGSGIAGWSGWDDMGDFFEGVGTDIGGWSGWNDMGDWFSGAANSIAGWTGWSDMGDWFTGAGNTISGWSGWNDINNAFDTFDDILGLLLFGSRQLNRRWGRDLRSRHKRDMSMGRRGYIYLQLRDIPEETHQCMEQCTVCEPFLVDQNSMISMICGETLVSRNATLAARMHILKAVYDAAVEDTNRVITKVAYDSSTFSMETMAFSDVYVTARTKGVYETYKSSVPYNVMDVAGTAAGMAVEFTNRWAAV